MKFTTNTKAASLVEYAILVSLVCGTAIAAVMSFGLDAAKSYDRMTAALKVAEAPEFIGPPPLPTPPASDGGEITPPAETPPSDLWGREYWFGDGVWLSVGTHIFDAAAPFTGNASIVAVALGEGSLGQPGDRLNGAPLTAAVSTQFVDTAFGGPGPAVYLFYTLSRPGEAFAVPAFMGVPPMPGHAPLRLTVPPAPASGTVSFVELDPNWEWSEFAG